VKLWGSDEELFDTLRRDLFTAVVGDVMDAMGLLRQFLPPQIKPLHDAIVVIGRAMTVLEADIFAEAHGAGGTDFVSQPFGLMFRALRRRADRCGRRFDPLAGSQ
jgi:hypothetical protein